VSSTVHKLLVSTWDVRSLIFIRLAVRLIFLTQGILKYIDAHMGVLRFAKIGFPDPDFTAYFVGTFEIACGLLVLTGLLTRLASIPLLIVILTAIATTKIPELAPESGHLVYGKRREDGLCDDDELALPNQRRSRIVVA
jgi:putative oxidoreductase